MTQEPSHPATPPATYVNFLRVSMSPSEFYLGMGQLPPEQGAVAQLMASLVTTPEHAKAMLRALAESVRRYEERFGRIRAAQPTAAAPSQTQPSAPQPAAPRHQAARPPAPAPTRRTSG